MIIAAIILGVIGSISATALAIRLRTTLPDLHHLVDSPAGTEWHPFWTFHFLSSEKRSRLPIGLKFIAIVSIICQASALIAFIFLVIRFAAKGGNL